MGSLRKSVLIAVLYAAVQALGLPAGEGARAEDARAEDARAEDARAEDARVEDAASGSDAVMPWERSNPEPSGTDAKPKPTPPASPSQARIEREAEPETEPETEPKTDAKPTV